MGPINPEQNNLIQKTEDGQDTLSIIRNCIPLLEKLAENSELLAGLTEPERIAFLTAAGKISRPDRKEIKKRNKEKKRLDRVAVVTR